MSRYKKHLVYLTLQLVESEMIAQNVQTQCRERGITFYRISPALDEKIFTTEMNNKYLCHMVVSARAKCKHQIEEITKILTSEQDQ